jgi:hypothetical protein
LASATIVLFTQDLRVHDHPAPAGASGADTVHVTGGVSSLAARRVRRLRATGLTVRDQGRSGLGDHPSGPSPKGSRDGCGGGRSHPVPGADIPCPAGDEDLTWGYDNG